MFSKKISKNYDKKHVSNSQLTNIISARLRKSQFKSDAVLAQKIQKLQTTLKQNDSVEQQNQNKKLTKFNKIVNQKDQNLSIRGKNLDFGKIFLKQKQQIVALKIKQLESKAQLEKAQYQLDKKKPKLYAQKCKVMKPWSYRSFEQCGYKTFYLQQIQSAQRKVQSNKAQQKQSPKLNIISLHDFNYKKLKHCDEDYSFLTKEDLQNTLDKSRASIKKLLIKHITNRKQMLKKNRYSNFQKKQYSSSLLVDTKQLKKIKSKFNLNNYSRSLKMKSRASQIQSILEEESRQNSPKHIKQSFPQRKIKVDRQFIYIMQRKINQRFKNSLQKQDVLKKLKKTILEPIHDRKQLQRAKQLIKIQKNKEQLQKFKQRRMSRSVSNLDSNSNIYSIRSSVKMTKNRFHKNKQFLQRKYNIIGSQSSSDIYFSQKSKQRH